MKFSPNCGSVCYAALQSSNTHEASLGWGLKSIQNHNPFPPENQILLRFFIPASPLALCDVFHFSVPSPGFSVAAASGGARGCAGDVCQCGHSLCHTKPKPSCSMSGPRADESLELCHVPFCLFIVLPKTRVCREYPSMEQQLGVTTLGTAKMSSAVKKPWILLGVLCRTKNVSKLYCASPLPQLNPKSAKDSAPGQGRALLSPGTTECAGFGLPLLVTIPEYFYDLGKLSTWPPLYLLWGIFIVSKFLRRQSLKWFYFFFPDTCGF